MNLSVSNIAWQKEETPEALGLLQKYGIENLEIAPGLLFNDLVKVSDDSVEKTGEQYRCNGFNLVAMQSLLYGAPAYSIFDDEDRVNALLVHLDRIITVADLLGIKNLVFGSPKHRIIKDVGKNNEVKAVSFFSQLSRRAENVKLNVCLEANPEVYGGNFITTTLDAIEFVKKINHPNFKLNLDTGAVLMNQEDFEQVIEAAKNLIGHIHISAPLLAEIDDIKIDHFYISQLIKRLDYSGFVSLEMGGSDTGSNLKILERNLAVFVDNYSS